MLRPQYDTAARLESLGVDAVAKKGAVRPRPVAEAIRYLMELTDVRQTGVDTSRRFDGVDPFERACALMEELVARSRAPSEQTATAQ